MRKISLEKKLTHCILGVIFILISLSSLQLYNAWDNSNRAERIIQISQCTEHFFMAIKELTFERGRTNVVLSTETPISQTDLDFIKNRRKLADEQITNGIVLLEQIDPVAAASLRSHYSGFIVEREKADNALSTNTVAIKQQIQFDWFTESTAFIYHVKNTINTVGKKINDTGLYSRHQQFQLDCMEFRLLIGQSSSILTAALSKGTPWTPKEYQDFIEQRAKADYLWSKLENSAADFKSDDLLQNKDRVYKGYYEIYRPAQDNLLPLAFTGKAPTDAVKQLQALSVPAFDSVFLFASTINQETIIYLNTLKNDSKRSLVGASLQFLLGLIISVFTIVYFKTKLFKSLKNIIRALENITVNDVMPILEEEINRQDEIGQLAKGAEMLHQSLLEERRLKRLNEYLASTDSLTGCLNKRAFYHRAEIELVRCARENSQIAFVIFDVDNMKYINDIHGHLMGDEMLKHLVTVVSAQCRPYDLIGRFGGDEFMVCFQMPDDQQIKNLVNRIHTAIQESPLLVEEVREPLRVSIGVISGAVTTPSPLSWYISQADIALYQAKQLGKNCIVFLTSS